MAEAVLKRASGWSIVLGILMIIAGIIAMFAPWEAGLVITIVVGWSAIFNGVAQIIFGFVPTGAGTSCWNSCLGSSTSLPASTSLCIRLAGCWRSLDPGLLPAGLWDFRAGAGISDQAAERLGMGAL